MGKYTRVGPTPTPESESFDSFGRFCGREKGVDSGDPESESESLFLFTKPNLTSTWKSSAFDSYLSVFAYKWVKKH